jgi:hypothetical protein
LIQTKYGTCSVGRLPAEGGERTVAQSIHAQLLQRLGTVQIWRGAGEPAENITREDAPGSEDESEADEACTDPLQAPPAPLEHRPPPRPLPGLSLLRSGQLEPPSSDQAAVQDPLHQIVARKVQRSGNGVRQAVRMRNGEVTNALFTYKRKSKSIQATCYHHPAEKREGKKSEKLCCRKSRKIKKDIEQTILELISWVQIAPGCANGQAHQKVTITNHGLKFPAECRSGSGSRKRRNSISSSRSSTSSSSSSSTSSSSGAGIKPSSIKGSAPPRAVSESSCWICGDALHTLESCPLWLYQLRDSRESAREHWQRLGLRRVARGRRKVPGVDMIEVPSDGACLFHAIGYGIGQHYAGTQLGTNKVPIPFGADAGSFWRKFLVWFVKTAGRHGVSIQGYPMKDWIHASTRKTIDEYCKHMGESTTWGGMLEAALLAFGFKRGLAIAILSKPSSEEEAAVLTVVGTSVHETIATIAVVWDGSHYRAASFLDDRGHAALAAYRAD